MKEDRQTTGQAREDATARSPDDGSNEINADRCAGSAYKPNAIQSTNGQDLTSSFAPNGNPSRGEPNP